eukprot:6353211-Prymnesium_polylepis.1
MSDGGAAAFGEILFNGLDVPVPFMCCDVSSSVADIFRVFVDIWKLKEPSVVLSVTGSTHLVDLDARIEAAFVKGLGLAASSAEAWVFSGGASTGVMALVGRALAPLQGKTPCIGLMAWQR